MITGERVGSNLIDTLCQYLSRAGIVVEAQSSKVHHVDVAQCHGRRRNITTRHRISSRYTAVNNIHSVP